MIANHFVLVPEPDIQPYLAKGYKRAEQSAREYLGSQWNDAFETEELVVLTIAAEKHEQLNQNPRKFMARQIYDTQTTNAWVQQCEVLELTTTDGGVVADMNGGGPRYVGSGDLFEDKQSAALSIVDEVRDQIALHRAAITNLESFLREHT